MHLYPIQSKSHNDHSAYANRALCYLKLGDWSKALDDCQLSIQFMPSYIKGHFYMGQAYIQLENYQAAVDSLQTGEYNMAVLVSGLLCCMSKKI